ncbi:MAG: hypothetical protein ACJ8F7_21605 [Gemmataceae bacterium]
MPITHATLNVGGQELALIDDIGASWRFKSIFTSPYLKRGRGYMQWLRGNFDESGKLKVDDRFNDQVSDFEIECGWQQPYIQQKDYVRDGKVAGHSTRAMKDGDAKKAPADSFGWSLMITVFAGAQPPDDLEKRGTVWIADPASTIWGLLSPSAFVQSAEMDSRSELDLCRTARARSRNIPWWQLTRDDIDICYHAPVITKTRVLMNVGLEII